MLLVVTLVLVAFVSAKPTHGPLGVEVKEAGKMRIGVEGSTLQIVGDGKCSNKFTIWYPVTTVTSDHFVKRDGFCPCIGYPGSHISCESSCPLKLDNDGSMEINVDEAPKGCIVTMKNAFLASKENADDDKGTSWIVYIAIFVPIGVLLLLLVFGVASWFCLRPRWLRAKAARAQKTAIGAEVDEEPVAGPPLTSVTSNAAISSVPASSGVTPVATALAPPVSSTAPSTQPPTTSATPEPLNAAAPNKLVVSETPKAPSNLMPIDQRPVHNIKKPVVVPPTSSGSSGRRRRKKLELSTEDFVEPDKLTGAPKPRKEPRKKRKKTTPEPARPPPPPLTDEEPPPTYLNEREQHKRGRAEAAVDVLKASAKATAEDCCPDDSKRASTEAAKAPPAKRQKENLVKFPLSDSRSQEKPEEVGEKGKKASK